MAILYQALHTIDVDRNDCRCKDIPNDFNEFIEEYVPFVTGNSSTKNFNVHDEHVTVPNAISEIVTAISNNDKDRADDYALTIAKKLLSSETAAQDKIYSTGKKIKRGSIVQAYVENEAGDASYIIAKVEHSEWYDGESLKKNFGFPSEKKNVWKSAVFSMTIDDSIIFGSVRVYTDNEAKYWAKDFLELTEERTDRTNTLSVMAEVEREFKRSVRSKSESDYYNLRNSLITNLKTEKHFDYNAFVDSLADYHPDEQSVDISMLQNALRVLPDAKSFDRQFDTVPSAITNRRKLKFEVKTGIEIRIDGDMENFKDDIVSVSDPVDGRYIKIKCEDNTTFNVFTKR